MADVWVLSHECGWSRMVPRSTPVKRRLQIIQEHIEREHPPQNGADRGIMSNGKESTDASR